MQVSHKFVTLEMGAPSNEKSWIRHLQGYQYPLQNCAQVGVVFKLGGRKLKSFTVLSFNPLLLTNLTRIFTRCQGITNLTFPRC